MSALPASPLNSTTPAKAETEPRAVDLHEAARLLGVSRKTMQRWTKAGHVRSIKVGRVRRYRRVDLMAFLAAAVK
jgi:excisionase family DNA binding protein